VRPRSDWCFTRPFAAAGNRCIGIPGNAGNSPTYVHFLDVLTSIVEEMDRRTFLLATDGKDKLDTGDFCCALPVLVVILEEWPGIMRAAAAEDSAKGRTAVKDRVSPRIEAAVGRLVAEGAKTGIRVVLLAQRFSSKALDTDSRSNFGVRQTLRVDNADAVGMLHDNATEWAPILSVSAPGQGLIERPGLGQRRYRADYTSYETYLERVKQSVAA
jgi:DNA segregation ATPase FtsK/SpoIIIE-like protein